MRRFRVFAAETPIGSSDLETGDPPMGIASGKFFSLPAYDQIQPSIIAARYTSQSLFALSVRTEDEQAVPVQGGIHIVDYSVELGTQEIEIEVLGIGYPLYETLFPGRHAAYVDGFRRKSELR